MPSRPPGLDHQPRSLLDGTLDWAARGFIRVELGSHVLTLAPCSRSPAPARRTLVSSRRALSEGRLHNGRWPDRRDDARSIVPPGQGPSGRERRVPGPEYADTPRFNLALITVQPHREGPELHVHKDEDDSFYVLEGELAFIADDDEVVAGPGSRSSSSRPVSRTAFANRGDAVVRMLNVHAPAGRPPARRKVEYVGFERRSRASPDRGRQGLAASPLRRV